MAITTADLLTPSKHSRADAASPVGPQSKKSRLQFHVNASGIIDVPRDEPIDWKAMMARTWRHAIARGHARTMWPPPTKRPPRPTPVEIDAVFKKVHVEGALIAHAHVTSFTNSQMQWMGHNDVVWKKAVNMDSLPIFGPLTIEIDSYSTIEIDSYSE